MAKRETRSGNLNDLRRGAEDMLWDSKKIAEVLIEAVPT